MSKPNLKLRPNVSNEQNDWCLVRLFFTKAYMGYEKSEDV